MAQLDRLHKINQLLQDRKVVSFATLQSELEASRATVKRDIEHMRSRYNAPIEYDRELNGYRFGNPLPGPRYELPGLWFNAAEATALLTTLQLLHGLQPGLLEGHVEPLVARLRGILGTGEHSWQEIEKRIRIFKPERREAKAAHFATIAAALLKRARLRIKHYNRDKNEETERDVSPQRLVHYRDNWYLDAYCHLREGLRSFAVDAIREAAIGDEKAKEVSAGELDEYVTRGYGIFAGREVQWAKLRFTPRAARWVSAQQWHPDERRNVERDGSYLLEVPYSDPRELLMEILKFGPDAEVIMPPSLRKAAAEALEKAARRYR